MRATELRGRIPRAQWRTTDQANVTRILDRIPQPLVSHGRHFYVLEAGEWRQADELVAQHAQALPEVIAAESPDKRASAERLAKWARRSRCKAVMNAAIAMLRGLTSFGDLRAIEP